MIVGIEIGRATLRAVAYRRFSPGREPDAVAEAPIGPTGPGEGDPSARMAEAVRRVLAELGARNPVVALAIPTAWCAYRTVRFPYRSPARVEGTLRYALEGRLPQPIEAYATEPLTSVLPAGADGARVFVAACPAARLSALLEACKAAGVDPCIVQPAAVSLAHDPAAPGGADGWMIRLDGADCEAVLAAGGEVKACGALRLGEPDPARALDAAQSIRFALRAQELEAAENGSDSVRLIGPPEQTEALAEPLEQALGVPVALAGADEDSTSWAAARGVAAQAARERGTAVNLRRGAHSYEPLARKLDRRVAAALVLAVAAVCMVGVHTVRGIRRAEGDLRAAIGRQEEIASQLADGSASVYGLEAAVVSAREAAAEAMRTRVVSCLGRWRDLMVEIPATPHITLSSIDIDQARIHLKALSTDGDQAEKLRQDLQRSAVFDLQEESSTVSKQPTGAFTVELYLRYR